MKAQISTFLLSSLFLSTVASGQVTDLRKWEKQTLWDQVVWLSKDFGFTAWRTSRGTLRVDHKVRAPEYTGRLTVKSTGKNLDDFIKDCRANFSSHRREGFSGMRLSMNVNPWATEIPHQIFGEGSTEKLSWSDVENRPRVTGVRLSVVPNQSGVSSEITNYQSYMRSVNRGLSEQLLSQMDKVLTTGEVDFDLGQGYYLPIFACDLALELVGLDFEFEVEMEPARAMTHHWVEEGEFRKIYQDLELSGKTSDLSAYQAGLILGRALQKNEVKFDFLKNGRDQKLLSLLFQADGSQFEVRKLGTPELQRAFAFLPEIEEDTTRVVSRKQSIELKALDVFVEAL